MKLKKLLASILCIAMVLSTMSFSVFAEDSTKGNLYSCCVNTENPDRTFITTETWGIDASESIELKIYDAEDNLLATTTAMEQTVALKGNVSIFTGINCEDPEWWTTTWTTMPNANNVPAKAELYIDGDMTSELEFEMKSYLNQPIDWADVKGVFGVNRVEAENAVKEDDLLAQSILITFNSVPCIDENMTVQLYHDDELLSTTNATAKRLGQAYSALTTNVVYSGDAAISGSWTTEINAPWTIDRAPNKIVVDIDGIETTFTNFEIVAFNKFEKFDLTTGTITPGYATVPDVIGSTSIWGEGGANAKESFVVELYAEDEKIGQASLNDYKDIIDGDLYVTWSIPYDGADSNYWTVDWYGNNPSVDTIPTKVVLVVDGVKVAENIVKMCAPDDLNPVKWDELEVLPAVATMGNKRFATIQAAVNAAVAGENEIVILPGIYDESFTVTQKDGINVTIKAENLGDVTLTGTVTIDGNKRGTKAETLDIENIVFDGSARPEATVYLIQEVNGKDAHNVTITNCKFFDNEDIANNVLGYKGGKVGPSGAKNITFESCTAEGLFALAQFNNAGKLTVNNCTIKGKYGVQTRVTPEVIFTNNTLEVMGYAVFAGQSGNKVDSAPTITLEGNKIESEGSPIALQNTKADVTLEQNTVDAAGNLFSANNADETTFNDVAITEENVIEKVGENNIVIPTAIKVVFEETDDEDIYNIVLTADDDIYEFVGAELTFKNTSTTAAGEDMQYEILGIAGKTDVDVNYGKEFDTDKNLPTTYSIRLVDNALNDGVNEMSGKKLVIGQVKFFGQGKINFNVAKGTVVTTEYKTYLEKYYVNDGDDDANDGDSLIIGAGIDGGEVTVKAGTVKVNIAYNHVLDGTHWDDNQITVTLKDGFGEYIDATVSGDRYVEFNDVRVGKVIVTLEAPGFRKTVYQTNIDEDKQEVELNFWNEVKRNTTQSPLAEIEVGKGLEEKNFLVGDIVMDYIIDEYDLAAVTSYYGTYDLTDAKKYIKYDLNRDGNIDIIDVAYVLHSYAE